MSQIENLTDNAEVTIATIAADGMQGLQSQIRAAIRRVDGDDLSKRFLNNALETSETLLADLLLQFNQDVDTYNSLADEYEAKDLAHKLAMNRVAELESGAESVSEELREEFEKKLFDAQEALRLSERECLNLQSRINDVELAFKTMSSQYNDLKRDCKRLYEMEPEKKIQQLAAYKKETHEGRAKIRELGTELTREQKERVRLSNEAQLMAAALEKLRSHNTLLASDIKRINGASQHDWNVKSAKGEDLRFWLHRYAYGISNKPGMNGTIPKTLYGVGFSYVVFSCRGYGVNILPNEWCAPTYNPFVEFDTTKPEDFDLVMESVYESELENIYPNLVARARWARTVPLSEVPDFPAKALKLLEGSHFKSLFDVVSRSPLKLLAIHGIGKGLAGDIGKACLYEAARWAEANGGIEDIHKQV